MSLVDEVRLQAAYIAPPSTDSDPIRRLHSAAIVLSLLADLNPATAARLQEYALAFAYYQAEEFEKLHSLSKRDATVQDIVNLWTEAADDFLELTCLHAKICEVAPGSRIAVEAWRLATYAKGMIAIQSNTLKAHNERCPRQSAPGVGLHGNKQEKHA